MNAMIAIDLTVNGRRIRRSVEARSRLSDLLRDDLGLTATKVGCEEGVCGSCTILVDGVSARACLVLAAQADGCEVLTLEGRRNEPAIVALQAAFVERNAAQCGFCTAGMLATAAELLKEPPCDRTAIRDGISANLCRCTGYQAIVDAVQTVAGVR